MNNDQLNTDGDGYGDYVIGIPGFDVSSKIRDAGRAQVMSGKNGDVLATVSGIASKDAMGAAVAGAGDIDGDGLPDVVVGAPNADDLANKLKDNGSVTVVFGPDGSRQQVIAGSVAKAFSGSALALGDVNGDGHADIIVGAPKADDVASKHVDAGSVTVISGSDFAPLQTFFGASAKAGAGSSVAVGDIDGDSNADIIIGAPNDGGTGSVTVYSADRTELLKKSGAAKKDAFGKSVASGDVNGDGKADVLVGAPGADNGNLKDVGSVTVLAFGDQVLQSQTGTVAKAALGNSVAAGDVNGDGFADVIAAAWKDDALPLKDVGSVTVWSGFDEAVLSQQSGLASKDYFGSAVASGDINGDGLDDLIIGIYGFDLPVTDGKPLKDAGEVRVLSGAGL